MTSENTISRRGLFMKLGILFNGLVATALTVPIVRFLLSSVTRGRASAYLSWVPLGRVSEFPEGETRLATFTNPYVTPTDGKTAETACWVRRVEGEQFQVFAINCAHLGCPVRWFARFGPAGTRAVRVFVQGAGRFGYDSSWRIADSGIANRLSFREQGAVRCTERVGFHRERVVRLQRNECFAQKDKDMGVIGQIGQWFDQRLQLAAPIRDAAEHPVPRNTASWFYVFGSAALTVFLLQLVTGILLALIYVPSASEAWSSLQALNHDVTLGWFIRAMHGWGSNFMVAIVLIHMV